MGVTRLEFIKGALVSLGFGAFGGRRLFAAPIGWKHGGQPNLVFGVLSDTHLRTAHKGNGIGSRWTDKYFVAALEYFKACNVDAVVHCGDFAHRGQTREMEFHAEAWRRVFGARGGPVKLFVTGNHDADGATYGDFVENRYPDPVERAKHVLATDMAANWERIWGEKYEPVWHKVVRGCHFFGCNWGVDRVELAKLINTSARPCKLDKGAKPFFFLTHSRPDAQLRKAVRPHRNAVSFFGHNHWSVANWNIPSIYYGTLPCIQCASCEPRGCTALVGDSYICKTKIEGRDAENIGKGRQGYVVRIYDDMMVIERREFSDGVTSLGADWVMPFGKTPHPFSRGKLKKVIGEPQFGKSVKLKVESVKLESGEDAVRVSIPLADGNPDSRVYAYEVVVAGKGVKLRKAVYATGVNMGIGHEPNGGMTTLDIHKSELPPGQSLTFAVRPLTSLGTSGRPITTEFKA